LSPFASFAEPEGIPVVAVAKVTREDLAREVSFDAEFHPFQEVDLHSKVSGFLQEIYVDIGDQVEAKQKLAVIEVPELRDDLEHAIAVEERSGQEVARAQAALDDARLTAGRLAAVAKSQPNLVAQQDLDTANARDRGADAALSAAKAAVHEAHANANKLRTMLNYSEIIAPFKGVITRRFADPGAMIQAGTSSSTQALPLVRVSENDKLRLSFPVSMSFVDKVKTGEDIEVRCTAYPAPFHAKISRMTRKVEMETRTMLAEADVTNTDLTIIPGSYANVRLKIDSRDHAIAVPIQAVSREKGGTVLVVKNQNEIEERPVKLGMETPSKVEVTEGLREGELVVVGGRNRLRPGQKVEPLLDKGSP
jgi:RND family efflux transporter MFP subunit